MRSLYDRCGICTSLGVGAGRTHIVGGESFRRQSVFQPARLRLAEIPIWTLFPLRRRLKAKRRKTAIVVLRMALTDTGVVLIQEPVDWVLDAPVAEGGSQEQSGIGGKDGIQMRCKYLGG